MPTNPETTKNAAKQLTKKFVEELLALKPTPTEANDLLEKTVQSLAGTLQKRREKQAEATAEFIADNKTALEAHVNAALAEDDE